MIVPHPESFNIEFLVIRISCAFVASILVVLTLSVQAVAGEIAGLPANTPPIIDRSLEFAFSNDLLGRGGSVDDFRTQQFIIYAEVGERWDLTIDHSILTLVDADEPGRTDQLSAALGYRLFDSRTDRGINRLTAGFGLRGYGDFGGERIQNGSHQLVRSSVEIVPYTDLDRTDATAWFDAQRFALFSGEFESDEWRFGYWLRGSALWASDGQLDSALGAYATAGRRSVDLWLGLRHDWRSGYEEPVLIETTTAEQDLAVVFGLRWGPIIFETVQQFDNKASYGQIRLVAAGFGEQRAQAEQSQFAFDAVITIPDVLLNVTGRHRSDWLNDDDSAWQRSLFVTAGYGEPQHDDDPTIYRRTQQIGAGVEWEKRLGTNESWVSVYSSLGIGWRQERVFAYENKRVSEQSDTVSRGALLAGLGLRFDSGEIMSRLNFRIQMGLSAWLPFSDARLDMGGETFNVQRPAVTATLGLTLSRFTD